MFRKFCMAVFTLSFVLTFGNFSFSQWHQQPAPVSSHLFDVCFTSLQNGWASGQSGTILKTTNGGNQWTIYSSPTSDNLNEIEFFDENRGWMVGDWNTILFTSDGGNSWIYEYDYNPYYCNYYGLKITKTDLGLKLWAVGGRNTTGLTSVMQSSGSGSWYVQYTSYNGRLVGIDFFDENIGLVAGDNGIILKTTNGGQTWIQKQSGTTTNLNGVRFVNSNIAFIAGDKGVILKTTNGGETWQSTIWPGYPLFFMVNFINESTGYIVGQYSTILKTTNQGITWHQQTVNANSNFQDICFVNENVGWTIGSDGIIVNTTNGGGVVGIPPSDNLPLEFSLQQCYPNPFNPSTIIKYELPKESYLTIKIYNAIGKEITTLIDDVKPAGQYEIVWDANDMTSGTYFYQLFVRPTNSLHNQSYSDTKKVVLLK